MTGDGTVVRLWTERDIGTHEMFVVEHNGAIRHLVENANDKARTIAEQAAKIERLTVKLRDMTAGFNATNEILDREQARAADLLKALENVEEPLTYGHANTALGIVCAAIAAARGATV